MRGIKLIATVVLLVPLTAVVAMGQVTVTGSVADGGSGDPLIGANVGVKNTLRGTSTDNNGDFSLVVPSLPVTLIVSYIGFERAEVEVANASPVRIRLTPSGVLLEDLVVVGSRFAPRTVVDSPVPIDNIKAADLIDTGQPTFGKMLMYTVPAFNSTQQTVSDATAHFDPFGLRALGPSRTLVLVNGKRKNASSLVYINDTPGKGEVGVDMNSIPAEAIERVEILRDGASAQYGSDAIAGVVNVVLKDDVDATDVKFFSGVTTEGDGFRIGYSVNTGVALGRDGYLNLTHSFYDQEETNRAGEPCAGGADPATCDGLFGGLLGLVDTPDEIAWLRDNPDLGMRVGQPNMTSGDVFYNAAIPVQANAELYSFGGITLRKGISYALYRAPYWIPDDTNIYHAPGSRYNGFHPTFEGDIFDNTFVVGLRGQSGGWDYDLSANHGKNTVDYLVKNSLNLDLGAQTPTVFNPGGYGFAHKVLSLDFSRSFGDIAFSAGSEFRRENYEARAGSEPSWFGAGAQSFPGLQPQNAADAFRNNVGVYGEVGVDASPELFVGGAARLENYSDFGQAFTWKVNGRYLVADGRASVRASASTGFRAPSLHQIHLSIIQTLVSGGTISNQGTFDNLNPVLRRLEVAELKEEESFNVSAGIAVQPSSQLYASIDVYQVDVDDRIVYSSSISGAPGTVVGDILDELNITSLKFFANAVDTRTRGIDLVSTYTRPAGPGSVTINLAANFNDTEIQGQVRTPAPIAAAGVELFDRKEQSRLLSSRPDHKVILGITYNQGPLRATLNNTRFGEVIWQHAGDASLDQTFDARIVTDLDLEYEVNQTVSVGASVNNLLNIYPEEIDTGGDTLTDLGGRFRYPWEVNQFGFNGTTVVGNLRLRL